MLGYYVTEWTYQKIIIVFNVYLHTSLKMSSEPNTFKLTAHVHFRKESAEEKPETGIYIEETWQ